MAGLVLELQKKAMSKSSDVDELLRMAAVIASKLKVEELKVWCEKELDGYPSTNGIPKYRILHADIKCFNPYNGVLMPIIWQDGPPEALVNRPICQPVGELQHLLFKADSDGYLTLQLPEKIAYHIMRDANLPRLPASIINYNQIYGILNAVRNIILSWTLKLEEKGVIGEEMTFSDKEKTQASSITYNIGTFSGVIGDVTRSHLQIGDYSSIHEALKEAGVSQDERNELETILDEMPTAAPEERRSLVKRGMGWVVRNGDKLGKLSDTLRGWFESTGLIG